MAIISVSNAKENELRRLLKKMDNTFGPMGSGGCNVREEADGTLIMKPLDVAPAASYTIRIKKNTIWATWPFAINIMSVLINNDMGFSVKKHEFSSPVVARRAFEQS